VLLLAQNAIGEDLVQEDTNLEGCSVTLNSYIFSLGGLARTNETEGSYEVTYKSGTGESSIDFNICGNNFRKCPDNVNDFANSVNENNTCNHLSAGDIS